MPRQRSEVLSLYREVIRTARAFYWWAAPVPARVQYAHPRSRPNKDGTPWCRVLRDSARKEFEEARNEGDPVVIARLLVVGRHCLDETRQKFNEMEKQIKKHIEGTRLR